MREEMSHYKSWSGLNQWLQECLCPELRGRIAYFLTRYHKVHDSYGRAAILLDGKELVCFSWIDMYRQEQDVSEAFYEDKSRDWLELQEQFRPVWEEKGILSEWDFLDAVLKFRNLSIQDALNAGNWILWILAILDRRVGKRTLKKIEQSAVFRNAPQWARQFYELRMDVLRLK